MRQVKDAWTGWVEGFSIRGVCIYMPALIARFPFALITSIDSNRHEKARAIMEKVLEKRKGQHQHMAVNNGMLVSGADILALSTADRTVFTGFDEVWLSYEKPFDSLSLSVFITSEYAFTDESTISGLTDEDWSSAAVEWMTESNFVLGLGDGIGLNYVTSSESVAQALDTINE